MDAVDKDGFIEYAMYVDNYYGTPRAFVEDGLASGKRIILEIEVQGALAVKERYPESALIFITTPSAAELKSRLAGRGTESGEVILARLDRAVTESEYIDNYDYIVCNESGQLEACVDDIHHIIESRSRAVRSQAAFIRDLKEQLEEFRK